MALGLTLVPEGVWAASELLGIPIEVLTPAGLLGLVILFIVMGRLVPRRTMEDVIRDRDEWRAAHKISEESRAELAGQTKELLEYARTTDAFIRSLPYRIPAPSPPPEGGPDDG